MRRRWCRTGSAAGVIDIVIPAGPGGDPRDPGHHPARGGARLRSTGAGRRHGTRAGRLSLNPLRHVDRVGTILLPGFLLIFQLADHPPGLVHVRLGQAGAGVGLEVPRPAPRHGAGRRGRAGDEFLPRLGGCAADAGANRLCRERRLSGREHRPASGGRGVSVLFHADQSGAGIVQSVADPAPGRRTHRGRSAAAGAGAGLGEAGAGRHRAGDRAGVLAAAH